MMDMTQFKKLSDKIESEAASLMGTPYAYERNLSEDDKSKAPQTLREAKEAILRMTPLLGDMLRLINSELGPDGDDGDDRVSEIRTLEDAQAVLSNAVSESSVRDALDAEDYHDHFPEDYVDGDVDMAREAETYRWGFNSLYNAVLRVLHAVSRSINMPNLEDVSEYMKGVVCKPRDEGIDYDNMAKAFRKVISDLLGTDKFEITRGETPGSLVVRLSPEAAEAYCAIMRGDK